MDSWRRTSRIYALWAVAVAMLLSTQYLFQAFVWRNWPWNEVLLGWLPIIGYCLLEGFLAFVVACAMGPPPRPMTPWYAAAIVASVAVGVAAANALCIWLGVPGLTSDLASVLARAIRWVAIAGCSVATLWLWWRTSALRAHAQAQDLRRVQSDHQLAQARLQALRNQIEPHFLFNTLATVRRLHQTQPTEGASLLNHFLDYLRSNLPLLQGHVTTLGREIELVRAYLAVVGVRMSGRLRVEFDVPANLRDCEIPPLCVATLVENAVKHGIGGLPEGGEIGVQVERAGDSVKVLVRDTGVGLKTSGGSGVGLANIRARLQTQYGADAALTLEPNAPTGLCARIRMPFRLSQEVK